MKGTGSMIMLKEGASTTILMVLSMKEIGSKTSSMEKDKKHGLMELHMWVITREGKSME